MWFHTSLISSFHHSSLPILCHVSVSLCFSVCLSVCLSLTVSDCLSLCLGIGASTRVWAVLQGIYQIPEENWLSFFLQTLIANSCSDVSRTSRPSSHLMLGFMSGLMLGRICACRHSVRSYMQLSGCDWTTLWLCHPPLQAFTIFLTSVWQWFLSLEKTRYDMDIPLRDEHSTTFYFLRAGQLRIFVCVFFYW